MSVKVKNKFFSMDVYTQKKHTLVLFFGKTIFVFLTLYVLYKNTGLLEKVLFESVFKKPTHLVVIFLCTFFCQVLTWKIFFVITNSYASKKITFVKISSLMVVSSLLNQLPVKFGFFARSYLLKDQHGVGYFSSLLIVLEILFLTILSCFLLLVLVLVQNTLNFFFSFFLFFLFVFFLRKFCSSFNSYVFLYRFLEVVLISIKYFLIFDVFFISISAQESVIVATISVFLMSIPFFSAGFGVREWLVAFFASSFVLQNLSDLSFSTVLLADVLLRIFEVALLVIIGIPFGWSLLQKAKTN